ncbi:MAG: hypothetical protein MZV70_40125 [Desulfobacterales bacterium]|nr:hypothetical protein [Desulfobacterales bacterium]
MSGCHRQRSEQEVHAMSTDASQTGHLQTGGRGGFRTTAPGCPAVAEAIIASCAEHECHTHIDYEPIPVPAGGGGDHRPHARAALPGLFQPRKGRPGHPALQPGAGRHRGVRPARRADLPQHPPRLLPLRAALHRLRKPRPRPGPEAPGGHPGHPPDPGHRRARHLTTATRPPAATTRSSSATPASTPWRSTGSPTASSNWASRCCRGS